MFSRRIAIGTVAAAAVASAVLGTTAATAAPAALTANITAGTAASGTAITLAAATTSTGVTFKDLRSGASLKCTSATATATAKTGKGQALAGIAKITKSTWTTCTGPLGLKFTVTQVGTWVLNATGATVSNKTPGTITTVSAKVSGGPTCTFPVTGSVAGSFTNTTTTAASVLAVASSSTTPTLTIGTVTGGCAGGIIKTGDKAQFTASYNVTGKVTSSGAAANPVKVVVS
jgi:hypothetical protein